MPATIKLRDYGVQQRLWYLIKYKSIYYMDYDVRVSEVSISQVSLATLFPTISEVFIMAASFDYHVNDLPL